MYIGMYICIYIYLCMHFHPRLTASHAPTQSACPAPCAACSLR